MEEPDVFFEEFADSATFTKADGSFFVSVNCLYEEGVSSYEEEGTSMQDAQSQVTAHHDLTSAYGERDRVHVKGSEYEIIDIQGDGFLRIFLLSPISGEPTSVSF